MIHYESAKFHPRLLFQRRGSVVPFSCMVALPGAMLAVVLKLLAAHIGWPWLGLDDRDTVAGVAWSAVISLLGFIVVFRTSQAYSRFWEGTASLYRMQGEWFNAASSLVAFCKLSKADKKDTFIFQHTLVRLVSLLNAVVLMDISRSATGIHGSEFTSARASELELIDVEGIDRQSLLMINEVTEKAELIFHWIMQLVVESDNRNIFSVPPPILSRAFQELATGMLRYHEARKIARVPMPFPYVQCLELLLLFHLITTPFLTCMWVKSAVWAAVVSFMQVFFLWSLNSIATELENPFGEDVNDLPARDLQLEMNKRLLMLLRPQTNRTARLSPIASFEEQEDENRPGCRTLGKSVGLDNDGITQVPNQGIAGAERHQRTMSLGSFLTALQDDTIVTLEECTPVDSAVDDPSEDACSRSKKRLPTEPVFKIEQVSAVLREMGVPKDVTGFPPSGLPNLNGLSGLSDVGDQLRQSMQQLLNVCEEIRDSLQNFPGATRPSHSPLDGSQGTFDMQLAPLVPRQPRAPLLTEELCWSRSVESDSHRGV
eukprot:CAMPEP_0203952862 /NCGR_PEP_ID=MMETSP0359-20131031/86381_1 /ASSEMBLY_ACC=CAM_ASM_000338 /TAXON_ID=268821 /ORGANISM="Scrippsiella Hangoei, Strain SHTV-5" /LENGTH=543 /DNA_ID=CAMNT_0050885981 /DNA_START=87 /DNA_END=1718 /DNA_ORIENTATION=+